MSPGINYPPGSSSIKSVKCSSACLCVGIIQYGQGSCVHIHQYVCCVCAAGHLLPSALLTGCTGWSNTFRWPMGSWRHSTCECFAQQLLRRTLSLTEACTATDCDAAVVDFLTTTTWHDATVIVSVASMIPLTRAWICCVAGSHASSGAVLSAASLGKAGTMHPDQQPQVCAGPDGRALTVH